MYRLFDADEVTFTALATPHWQRTRSLARGKVLLIGDTTETDIGIRRAVEGLGPTGDGDGLGFFLHSSMMVDAASGEIFGLAGQELFYRWPAPKNENSYRALQRSRASAAKLAARYEIKVAEPLLLDPEDLVKKITKSEVRDLVEYLSTLRNTTNPAEHGKK